MVGLLVFACKMMEYDLAYEEDNQRLPSFQQLLRTAGQPSFNSAYKQNQQQYLDDFDLSVNEESLSYFLCMKTGMVYLGCKFPVDQIGGF